MSKGSAAPPKLLRAAARPFRPRTSSLRSASLASLQAYVEDHFAAAIALWKRYKARRFRHRSMGDVFGSIYRQHLWGDGESLSGAASSLTATAGVRTELPALLRELGIRSMLDIPCGDFHWMKEAALELDVYIGADIVGELTKANKRFENEGRTFTTLDLTRDPLPKVDLVLCRDCLIHFSLLDARRGLDNIRASGSRYLLTTTFTRSSRRNIDIVTGQWRPLNLQRPPFSLPAPLSVIREGWPGGGRFDDRSLGLWRMEDL